MSHLHTHLFAAEAEINTAALKKVDEILDNAEWVNTHELPACFFMKFCVYVCVKVVTNLNNIANVNVPRGFTSNF